MKLRCHSKTVLLTASSLLALALASPAAYAQDADDPEQVESEERLEQDVIVVKGIRGSLAGSLNDKRNADQIIDTINAEDIGKSSDQNIADALNRISGVSITRESGEGSLISIRGASPDETTVTLNGAVLGSTGINQAVDLSSFSADILAKVEVIKTPSADDEEGSLGGLVNLITRKPLEIERNVRTLSAEYRFRDLGNNSDFRVNGAFSQKFFNDRFGIFGSVTYETDTIRQDEILFQNFTVQGSNLASDVDGNVISNAPLVDVINDFLAANPGAPFASGAFPVPSPEFAPVVFGIVPDLASFQQAENERDRFAADTSAQWRITDKTDITLNFNYALQEIDNGFDRVTTRQNPNNPFNLIAGIQPPGTFGGTTVPAIPTQSDPQELFHVIDPETSTFVRFLNRFALGDISSAINQFENENITFSGEINHQFTDRFRVTLGGSIQRSDQDPGTQIFVNAQNFAEAPPRLLVGIPVDELQPVGIDCLTGTCVLVGGTTPADLGEIITDPTAEQIFANPGLISRADDNTIVSGFVPDDLAAQHLAFLSQSVIDIQDRQNVAFADFDFETDRFGITSVEFGGKWTGRNRLVDTQQGTVNSVDPSLVLFPPGSETPIVLAAGLTAIPANVFATGEDVGGGDFLRGFGIPDSNFTDGFPAFDPLAAFNAVAENDSFAFEINNLETRTAEFDNFAAYTKFNYSYFNDRLRGDFGVRWIRTDFETTGFAGVNFFTDPRNANGIFDPFTLREVAGITDPNLPACPSIFAAVGVDPITGVNEFGVNFGGGAFRLARVDGLGVDVNGTETGFDDTPLPDVGPCIDAIAQSGTLDFGGGPFAAFNEFWLGRFSDLSTSQFFFHNFDDDDSNGTGFILDADGNLIPENLSILSFPVSGSNSYDRFLPNLNVNFLINDQFIARAAVSRTLARPPIDSTRPGFVVNEFGFGSGAGLRPGNTISLFNPQLEPLTSINFDIGLEWYFQKDALLSVNFFQKNITNRIAFETGAVFLQDLRDGGEGITTENVILPEEALTEENCFPRRFIANDIQIDEDLIRNGTVTELCNVFLATQQVNVARANITGVEAQYQQNFTFLPGYFLGGLGMSANYTFQDSFTDDTDGFPVELTPRHSWNLTGFWQRGGHQARLAWSATTDTLVQESFQATGSLFRDGRNQLDASGAFQLAPNVSLTFSAVNLLDESFRTFFISRNLELPVDPDAAFTTLPSELEFAIFDEGNALENDATQSRTVQEFRVGRTFRFGVRVEF